VSVINSPTYLRTADVASLANVSRQTILAWWREGRLGVKPVHPSPKLMLWPREATLAALRSLGYLGGE
jgi:predicted site-specific integrase-resolvase